MARITSVIATVLWDLGMQAPLATRPRLSRGSSNQDQGTRRAYKLPSGKYRQAGVQQQDSMKIAPTLEGLWKGLQVALTRVFNEKPAPQAAAMRKS